MQVFMVINSAGELMGWAKPLIEGLKRKSQTAKITVIIPPCQFATGMEKEVAKSFSGVDSVLGPTDYLRSIFLGIRWSGFREDGKGVVVFLGGDPVHAVLLSRRLRVPALAYIQKPRWKTFFRKFMVIDEKTREEFVASGVEPSKVIVVGDLMADAVELRMSREEVCSYWELDPKYPIISLMPGSRSDEVRYLTPFFLKVAELVKKEFPKAQSVLILSPFASEEQLVNPPSGKLEKVFPGIPESKLVKKKQWKLITNSNVEVLVVTENHYDMMNASDLVITIPGTKTAEMAFLGTPMVVTVPLNKPEAIPLNGLPGLIGHVPWLGPIIKAEIVKGYSRKVKFTALPNLRARKEIVPELRGIIKAEDVSEKAIELLQDPVLRKNMACELRSIMGAKGAADRTAEAVLEELK
jgi:lipid-A-disaccharide synthase